MNHPTDFLQPPLTPPSKGGGKEARIVIVGAGFGGLYTYLYLRKFLNAAQMKAKVTIISKNNYFLFTPLLHEAATGSVRGTDIIQSLRQIVECREAGIVIDDVKRIDRTRRQVIGKSSITPYDYLVLSPGATTRMYSFKPSQVLTLKSLGDARKLKNHIIWAFNEAHATHDLTARARFLTFVVIGGGPTGAELAAEIEEFTHGSLLEAYPDIRKDEINIVLVHAGRELVEGFHPALRRRTQKILSRKPHMKILLSTTVVGMQNEKLILHTGQTIDTHTPILVGGIEANVIPLKPELGYNPCGQLPVNQFLQSEDLNIFVVGDAADVKIDGVEIPETAQAAIAEAKVAAYNIISLLTGRTLKTFRYFHKGDLLSLGRFQAGGRLFGILFSGPFAWIVWRFVYLKKMIGWPTRFKVAFDWFIDLFYKRDISEL